ncbi:leucine-rich repeat receptor-like serine/threonine-protein kinase BAM1 [Tanacetum coccineum]
MYDLIKIQAWQLRLVKKSQFRIHKVAVLATCEFDLEVACFVAKVAVEHIRFEHRNLRTVNVSLAGQSEVTWGMEESTSSQNGDQTREGKSAVMSRGSAHDHGFKLRFRLLGKMLRGKKGGSFALGHKLFGDFQYECLAIAGSYGYIAPESAYTLKVDEKSDVYA